MLSAPSDMLTAPASMSLSLPTSGLLPLSYPLTPPPPRKVKSLPASFAHRCRSFHQRTASF
jgi:hypothetical protein